MASPERLEPLSRADIGAMRLLLEQAAAAQATGLSVRLIEPLRVVSLRHLAEGAPAIAKALHAHGFLHLPSPGCFEGSGPFLLWRKPGELLLVGTEDSMADGLLLALPAGLEPLAYALDLSGGSVLFELQGRCVDALLERLLDAAAIPHRAGQAHSTRLGDIVVIAMRQAPDRVWLLADRSNDDYLARWIAFATAAAVDCQPGPS